MKWNIEGTDEFAEWYWRLSPEEQDSVDAAIEKLEEEGPALRRPFSGHIEGSEFHHMKELIPIPGNLRILYAFDPRRTAILLIGGDKTNDWDTLGTSAPFRKPMACIGSIWKSFERRV